MGFHVGWFMFWFFWLAGIQLFPSIYAGVFIYACISSFTSYVLDAIIGDCGIKISKNDD